MPTAIYPLLKDFIDQYFTFIADVYTPLAPALEYSQDVLVNIHAIYRFIPLLPIPDFCGNYLRYPRGFGTS